MIARMQKEKDHIMSHREIELFEHLARGRQLRSQAFVAALAWVFRGVKGLFSHRPAAKQRQAC